MLRSIRLLTGAMAVLFGSVLFAQPPKDPKDPPKVPVKDPIKDKEPGKEAPKDPVKDPSADSYFPLRAKTKWTYKVQDQFVEVAVTKTEKFGGEDCTQLDTSVNGKLIASELYAVRPDGVYRVKVKDDKIDPPVKVLALPVKKDATWEVKSKVGTQSVSGTFKIKDDKEKLKTPAGDFENVVLVEGIELDVAGTKTTVRLWFVKDKGMVKSMYKIQDAESVLELNKFETPPVLN